MGDVAVGQINDHQAAEGLGVLALQGVIQVETAENLVVARQGKGDQGKSLMEGQAPHVTGAKGDRLETSTHQVKIAELAVAGVGQPQPVR